MTHLTRLLLLLIFVLAYPLFSQANDRYLKQAGSAADMVEQSMSRQKKLLDQIPERLRIVRTETVNGITWQYYLDDNGNAVIGPSHWRNHIRQHHNTF